MALEVVSWEMCKMTLLHTPKEGPQDRDRKPLLYWTVRFIIGEQLTLVFQ